MRLILPILIALLTVCPVCGNELDDLLRQAQPENPKAKRMAALEQIPRWGVNNSVTVRRALEPLLEDPDPEIRAALLTAIGWSAQRNEVCPLCLIESVTDPVKAVRTAGLGGTSGFERFPPKAIPLIHAALKSNYPDVRESASLLLAKASENTPETRAAIADLFDDPDYFVRHNAQVAHFELTDDLQVFVPHLLRGVPEAKDGEQRTQTEDSRSNLLALGQTLVVQDFVANRTDETVGLLLKHLSDVDLNIRRGAARNLRAVLLTSKPGYRAIKKQKPKNRLSQLLKTEADNQVRADLADAIQSLENGPPKEVPDLDDLLEPPLLFPPTEPDE